MRKAKIQGEGHHNGRTPQDIPEGYISWQEHEEAWRRYHEIYSNHQDAERINERGGFGYWELVDLLGRRPRTWEPREERHRGFIPADVRARR